MAGIYTVNLCCFVFQIVQRAYVLCRLKRKKDKKTGSYIPTPDEAVAGGFSPEMNYNDVLSELSIIQETWLMNMEFDNSSTGTGIHLNGPANNMTLDAGPSHHFSDIASDIRNYQVEEMTSDVRMSIFFFSQGSLPQI